MQSHTITPQSSCFLQYFTFESSLLLLFSTTSCGHKDWGSMLLLKMHYSNSYCSQLADISRQCTIHITKCKTSFVHSVLRYLCFLHQQQCYKVLQFFFKILFSDGHLIYLCLFLQQYIFYIYTMKH